MGNRQKQNGLQIIVTPNCSEVVLTLEILHMTSGSLWSWRRKGELPRCKLHEGWIIAVGHRDSISGSPLDPLSHMIQASHCVCQKSMSFRGMRGCRTTFALGICTLGNLSKYPKLVLLPYVRSRSSLSLLHLVSSVVGSRTCSDWLCTLILLQWITQNKIMHTY